MAGTTSGPAERAARRTGTFGASRGGNADWVSRGGNAVWQRLLPTAILLVMLSWPSPARAGERIGRMASSSALLHAFRTLSSFWLPFEEGTCGRFVFRTQLPDAGRGAEAGGTRRPVILSDRMLAAARARFDRPGLVGVSVMRAADDGVIVDWFGDRQAALAAMHELGSGPVLEFRLADTSATCMAPADALLVAVREEGGGASISREINGDLVQLKSARREDLEAFVSRLESTGSVPQGRRWIVEQRQVAMEEQYVAWCLKEAVLTDADVAGAQADLDEYGNSYVAVEFMAEGADVLTRVTGENVGGYLAILVDGKVVSVPVIREAISGGRAQVTMGGFGVDSQAQAVNLASQLEQGGLGIPLILEQEQGPSGGLSVVIWLARLPPFPEPMLVSLDLLLRIRERLQ